MDIAVLVVLEEPGMPGALLDEVSTKSEERANVMLVFLFFLCRKYYFELPKQKRAYAVVDFVYEHKEEARALHKNTGHGT